MVGSKKKLQQVVGNLEYRARVERSREYADGEKSLVLYIHISY